MIEYRCVVCDAECVCDRTGGKPPKYCDECREGARRENSKNAMRALRERQSQGQTHKTYYRRCVDCGCLIATRGGPRKFCDTCKAIRKEQSWRRYNRKRHEDTTAPLVPVEAVSRLVLAAIKDCPGPPYENCATCTVSWFCYKSLHGPQVSQPNRNSWGESRLVSNAI